MAWRRARSLVVLGDEIEQVAPGTTVWDIGDEDHQDQWSDHNPNAADVVCAADILSNAGLDLAWLVATITATDPPALKYVIYRDRIWFPQTGWQPYRGAFHSHVHVSVGWGPDGRSTGPYDDTSPWGLTQEDDMPITKDDAHTLWGSDDAVRSPTLHADGTRRTDAEIAANPRWAGASFVRDGYDNVARIRKATREGIRELAAGQAAILAAVGGQDVTAAVRAELDRAAAAERAERAAELAALRDGLGAALLAELGPALVAELGEAAGELSAAVVEAAVGRALARTSLTVAAGPEPA